MMLLNVAVVLWALLLPSSHAVSEKPCPVGCNCTSYVATCETLNFPSFTHEFLELRLIRLKEPIAIDSDFFARRNLYSLTNLYIENSNIIEIDPTAFQQNLKLNSLHFVNCTLSEIKPDTFLYATSLKLLNIDQCNLEKLESLRSESLLQLKISSCNLKEITSDSFETLEELTDLNLQRNKIEKIDGDSFKNLIFLSDLNLSNNNITQLPSGIFSDNEELMSVDMSGNPLRTIDSSIFTNLEQLILSNCQLREFTGGDFEDMENLDLSNNYLSELSSNAFSGMTSLEYLNLSINNLTSLPSDIFANNSRLSRIILDQNDLQRLPKFKNSENLLTEYFSCKDCGLESIEAATFEDMPALISLDLSYNRIQKINSDAFNTLRSLRVLDISYNSIQQIDMNIFERNTALKKLNLAGNNIPSLNPEIFARNRVLETLDMSNNGMEEIWKPNAQNTTISSLSVLNLADNKLSQISVSDLEVVPNLKVLNLNNNDLTCTNDLKAGILWLNMRTVIHSPLGLNAELGADEMMTYTDTYWDDLYSIACDYMLGDDDDDDDESEKVVYDDIDMMKIMNENWFIDREDANEYIEPDITMNRIYEQPQDRYSFLWPMLVFIVTALFVLFIVTNIILCVLRKRGQLPRNINLSWKNGHSGFVYKPLTEDITRPRSIIITHLDKPQTPNL